MAKGKGTRHVVCAGAGIGFVLGGWWYRLDTDRFLENAVTAEGTVMEITSYEKRNPRQTIYKPIVQFEDGAGELVSFKGPEIGPEDYAVGDAVAVLYEQDKPESARIDSFLGVWGNSVMMILFGIFFVVKGAISYTWITVFSRR